MHALVEHGERAQAIKEYARCREAFRRILETEPSGETRALHEAIKRLPIPLESPTVASSRGTIGMSETRPAHAGEPARQRLRVGVVPFVTIGSSAGDALAFSLAQEVAAALARFRWFDVIASHAFEPQARAFDLALQDRGLDYAIDGTLTAVNGRLQISVRLLQMSGCARPVWSEKFEASLDDLGCLDEIVPAPVVARIDPVILFREASAPPREPLSATALTVRAMPMLYSMERPIFEEAGRILEEAVRREPDHALAAAWAAYWQVYHVGQGWTQDVAGACKRAHELSLRAIRLDPNNAEALAIYGHLCSYLNRDFDAALHYFDRALKLNPSLGLAWTLSAATFCYIGEPETALARLDHYRELAPFDPYLSFFETIYPNAHMLSGNYEQAIKVGRRTVRANPEFVNGYKALIASLGHLGCIDEATHYRALLAQCEPSFSIERFVKSYPFQQDADRQRYAEGLRLAGVPESERAPSQPLAGL